jgi:hypothetical protein
MCEPVHPKMSQITSSVSVVIQSLRTIVKTEEKRVALYKAVVGLDKSLRKRSNENA